MKRENGMGTIYQRENGTWVGKIRERSSDGKMKSKCFSGKSEAEVKRKIREHVKSKEAIDPTKVSFETYISRWLRSAKQRKIKDTSYDRLENTALYQLIPKLGSMHMSQIGTEDIQKALDELSEEYSFSTTKKAYDTVKSVFKYAVVNMDVNRDPTILVNMPSKEQFKQKKEIRFFNAKECASIVEECRRQYKNGKPVYAYGEAFVLIMYTGLRMGELLGLEKNDLDTENGKLRVRRNAQLIKNRDDAGERTGGRQLVFNTTKTYSGTRDIPLNKTAREAFERLCASSNSDKLVCTGTGKTVPPDRLERSFYRILNNVGIEQTGLHSLRHTFASMLFAKKVDIKAISTLLGHSSVQITYDTYVHLLDNVDIETVAKLDDAI